MASEPRRGCGYRKVGGLYMVDDGWATGCCQFPIPLEVCPTCNSGIKKTRGFQWIDIRPFLKDCAKGNAPCSLNGSVLALPERVGLMWIGAEYYPTVESFNDEAAKLGISRRIKAIPKGFEVGKTLVCLAHPRAIHRELEHGFVIGPGIFRIIRPHAFEKIITESMALDDDLMEGLKKKGITPSIVNDGDLDHRGPPGRPKMQQELRV